LSLQEWQLDGDANDGSDGAQVLMVTWSAAHAVRLIMPSKAEMRGIGGLEACCGCTCMIDDGEIFVGRHSVGLIGDCPKFGLDRAGRDPEHHP
jgi:hypothetical protein